jgi:hypothetical protein
MGIKTKNIVRYWPLISLIITSILAASAINWHIQGDVHVWMHYFMGMLLVIFSTLKIFHPIDFADAFQMYDLIAKRSRSYAFSYPIIELILGLAYLSFFIPILIYLVTIVLLTIGAVGVIKGLRAGLDINCPCMGTALEVPLSTVTLIEDIGMALMALMLLIGAIL